ncbi:MAG: uncharacterized protein H6R27_581 [Proteobacteria bacterium]|nr:uncharacterized protein [Pseudomonadota bacterium]
MIRDLRAPRTRGARARSGRALASLLLPWMAACSTVAPLDASLPGDAPRRIELTATPFFPQEDHQCGPAALATVLAASGVPVVPADLVAGSYLPGREGSLQAELVAAARRHGRLAYVLPGDPGSLVAELAAGRPLLVLQNLGVDAYPRWHYAVLVGLDAGRDEVILRSGRRQREVMSWARFDDSWRRGGRWAVVLLEPGALPENPEPLRFLEAIAGLEAAGRLGDAAASYAAAAARWPEHALAQLGLGNNAYARGDLAAAVASYQRGVALAPGNAVLHNNLAQALLDAGCPRQAEAEARTAALLAAGTPLEGDVRDTLEAIEAGPRQEGRCAVEAGGSATGQPLSSRDDLEARAADR